MNKLQFSRDAMKFLEGLPTKQFRQVLLAVLALTKDPHPHDSQPLHGYPYRRKDIGEDRVIYHLADETVIVVLIGKRNDDEVYKRLGRK
ncbi:hypothetical protein BH09SUM1_BH09SUM1_06760 [soil metagenome]